MGIPDINHAFLFWSSIFDLRNLTLNRPLNSQFIQLGPRFRLIGSEKNSNWSPKIPILPIEPELYSRNRFLIV